MADAQFVRWLHRQTQRDDHVGRLSRAVMAEAVPPGDPGRDMFVAALDQARAEYREETSHPSERFPAWGAAISPPVPPGRPPAE